VVAESLTRKDLFLLLFSASEEMNRVGSVGIVAKLRAGQPRKPDLMPDMGKGFFFSRTRPDQLCGAPRHLGTGSKVTRVRGQLKCDGTCAETRFLLSAKRRSPFKSAGASVQSTTGSRGVRISGSNAGYTMFRSSVKGTDYQLHFPFTYPPVRHRVPSHFNWSLPPRHGMQRDDFAVTS
jgi:hypothetical protein